jgi:hypothetical protein
MIGTGQIRDAPLAGAETSLERVKRRDPSRRFLVLVVAGVSFQRGSRRRSD